MSSNNGIVSSGLEVSLDGCLFILKKGNIDLEFKIYN